MGRLVLLGRHSGGLYTGEDHVLCRESSPRSSLVDAHCSRASCLRNLAAYAYGATTSDRERLNLPMTEPTSIALAAARKTAAERRWSRRSNGWAPRPACMMIVAHPDDEDGALLTYLSRGLGVRCTLLR